MKTESEDPKAFHERMWREHGPKTTVERVTGDALLPGYYDGFQAGAEYTEPRAHAAAHKDVAQRLAAILFPGPDEVRPDLSLAEALQAVKVRLDARREWFRDAALEEAAALVDDLTERYLGAAAVAKENGWAEETGNREKGMAISGLAMEIRALKSKPATADKLDAAFLATERQLYGYDVPAPKPPIFEAMTYGTKEQADEAAKEYARRNVVHDFDGSVTAAEAARVARAAPVQCLVPGCDRPHQHEGPHTGGAPVVTDETARVERELSGLKPCTCHRSAYPHVHIAHRGLTADECSRAGKALAAAAGVVAYVVEPGGAKMPPEPVHDFGWALAQMRAGKSVERRKWKGGRRMHTGIGPEPKIITHAPGFLGGPDESVRSDDVLATDWEVVE